MNFSALRKRLLLWNLSLFASLIVMPQASLADGDIDGDGVADGIEAIDGTDPNDIDSYIEHGGSRYCFDWNGFLDYLAQVIELRNSGCGDIGVRVDLHSIDGAVADTTSLTLAPSEQFDFFINELDGFSRNSYGLVCATITNGDPDSLVPRLSVYSLSANESFRFAYTIPFTPFRSGVQYLSYNHIYPTLKAEENGYPSFGFIQVANDETTAQNGELIFYDFDGVEIRRDRLSIQAKGRVDVNTHEVGTDTVGLAEWRPAMSDKRFRVTLNRYYAASAVLEDGFRSVASIAAKVGSGALRAAPFSTVSRIAVIELSNALNSPVQVPVLVYTQSGSLTSEQPGTITIPAKATRHVLLNAYVENGLGKAEIDPAAQRSVIASLFEYQMSDTNALSSASVGDFHSGFGSFKTTSYNNFLGGCRLRLANLAATERTSTISMTRYDGTMVEIDSPISVPANGINEVDICSNESVSAYGEVKLTPSAVETLVGEIVRSNREGNAEFRVPLSERSICTAEIDVSPASLALTASGPAGQLTISNNSQAITATNISLTLPAGWSDVTQNASDCASLEAGENCTITITPGGSTYAEEELGIQGDNTGRTSALVSIQAEPTANITVAGSPLELATNGSPRNLTLTNTSGTATAMNIVADFAGTALDGNVTVSGNTCASVLPGASCTITFTPGGSVVAETSFTLSGSNTNTLAAAIEIVPSATLTMVNPATGTAAGGTAVTLSGTDLTGATSVTFDGVAATAVNVVNSTTVTAVAPAHAAGVVDVQITTPTSSSTLVNGFTYAATAVGQSASGGVIACIGGGLQNVIKASANAPVEMPWGGSGTITGASSAADGASNTTTIVSALGNNGGTIYAAKYCSDYEVDSQGNTPCQAGNECYDDWFLPALLQFDCFRDSVFANAIYWTSSEGLVNPATDAFSDWPGFNFQAPANKAASETVRCVRAFSP